MEKVGPQRVADLARALGVRQSQLDLVPSLALGTSPVTLMEMVSAYASIANEGSYVPPLLVLRVEDRSGNVLQSFAPAGEPQRAMPRASALTLVNAMRGVIDFGTGNAIRQRYGIQADVAGKTGTTQNNTDGWFIMMSPQLVAGARVGFNDNSVTMGNWGQGARSALPMVGDVFQQALRKHWIDPKAAFDVPRTRPAPPAPPAEESPNASPLESLVGNLIEGVFRQFRGAEERPGTGRPRPVEPALPADRNN
jgi:penicillin-binding protein 1A